MMLNVMTLEAARALSVSLAERRPAAELLPLREARGRILYGDVFCNADVPAFNRSTMDGYAVRARDTFGASASQPCMLRICGAIKMGKPAALSLSPGACAAIPTGGMLPEGADAVIPVEYTEEDGLGFCFAEKAVGPGENVTRRGDDAAAGALLAQAGTALHPRQIGLLSAAGITEASVCAKPRAGILSTGNELVPPERAPGPGEIRDVNGGMLCAMLTEMGCASVFYGVIPDEPAALAAALRRAAAENDFLVLSGGSSAGDADLTAGILAEKGELLAHGIAVKPGKPTVLGRFDGKPVFGLPGHPAAAYFVADALIRPFLEAMLRTTFPERTVRAVLKDNISSNHGRGEFVCVRLSEGAAVPYYGKSGVISLLSQCDGYLYVPRDAEGFPDGKEVEVRLF